VLPFVGLSLWILVLPRALVIDDRWSAAGLAKR